MFEAMAGNRYWKYLLDSHLRDCKWYRFTKREKSTFCRDLMVEFHTATTGWFWQVHRSKSEIRRLTVEELLHHSEHSRPLVGMNVQLFLDKHPEYWTLERRQYLDDLKRIREQKLDGAVDLDRFHKDSSYAADLAKRVGNNAIGIDVVRKAMSELGCHRLRFSIRTHKRDRDAEDIKKFIACASAPSILRPHLFKSKNFLINFACKKLNPPVDFMKKWKCLIKIKIDIIIIYIINHVKEHPEIAVVESHPTRLEPSED